MAASCTVLSASPTPTPSSSSAKVLPLHASGPGSLEGLFVSQRLLPPAIPPIAPVRGKEFMLGGSRRLPSSIENSQNLFQGRGGPFLYDRGTRRGPKGFVAVTFSCMVLLECV